MPGSNQTQRQTLLIQSMFDGKPNRSGISCHVQMDSTRQIGVLWIHLFAFTFALWRDKLFKWMDRIVLGKMDSSKDNNL
jgi:hypothetical protein